MWMKFNEKKEEESFEPRNVFLKKRTHNRLSLEDQIGKIRKDFV